MVRHTYNQRDLKETILLAQLMARWFNKPYFIRTGKKRGGPHLVIYDAPKPKGNSDWKDCYRIDLDGTVTPVNGWPSAEEVNGKSQ